MASLTLQAVRKSFAETEVLHGIDLQTADGEFVVLVGPSGCGKSTLLRVIAGLESVSDGLVLIDEQPMNQVSAADRGLAMVFQSYALYPHMSVYQNMAFGLENAKMPRAQIDQRVKRASEILRIGDLLQRKPKALSGGQRQRVAIGRAIVREPKIFLFDEPLSNLDAELRVAMRKELAALHADIGGSMIYVTHDQTEAMTLADRIVVLNQGNVEQIGTPLQLYNRPANQFVAGFIGSPRMNFINAEVGTQGGRPCLLCGETTLSRLRCDAVESGEIAIGDSCVIGVRPEHIAIVDPADADMSAAVDLAEQLGGETYLYCSSVGFPQLTAHQIGQLPVARGDRLGLRFAADQVHFFAADGQTIVQSNA